MMPDAFTTTMPEVHFMQRPDGSYLPMPARLPLSTGLDHPADECAFPQHHGEWATAVVEIVGIGHATVRGHVVNTNGELELVVDGYYRR